MESRDLLKSVKTWKELGEESFQTGLTPSPLDSERDMGDQPKFLLIKQCPKTMTLEKIRSLFQKMPSFEDLITIPNSRNIYAKFGDSDDVKTLMDTKNENINQLNLVPVAKVPLDLNQTSKIVLVTIYNEKIKITVQKLHEEFSTFGEISKIIIFQKKNYQVFVEFLNREDAVKFKKKLHNQNHRNLFFLKI